MFFLIFFYDNFLIYYPNIFFAVLLLLSIVAIILIIKGVIYLSQKIKKIVRETRNEINKIRINTIKIDKNLLVEKIIGIYKIALQIIKIYFLVISWRHKVVRIYALISKKVVSMRFSFKLFFSILIIYLCQLLIWNVFPSHIPVSASNYNFALQQGIPDIFYFVDSTSFITDSLDKNTESINQYLQHLLPNHRVAVIGRPAGNPDIYGAYAAYASRVRPLPQYIIVQINMRSFSPPWDKESTWGFEEEKRYWRIFRDTPIMPFWPFFSDNSFFNLDSLPENKHPNNPIFNKLQKLGFMKDEKYIDKQVKSGDDTKDLIEWYYMYHLTKDHRKIKSLLEIADTFASKKTRVIFYFTPINYQPKKAYRGNEFEAQLKKNINLVKSLLLKKQVTVLDLSMSLPLEDFAWREDLYVNEHMAEKGRRFVAQSLAHEIKRKD